MYLPKAPPKPKENPFAVQKSKRFITSTVVLALFTTVTAAYLTLEKVRERQRRGQIALARQRNGPRVVIIGAGTAGSALAASLTRAMPETHVTVIERERKHVFQAMVPLAHVGHRSYDLNTTGGVDFLRSPATWNVTREAQLVRGEVLSVDPTRNVVIVRSDHTANTLTTPEGALSHPNGPHLAPNAKDRVHDTEQTERERSRWSWFSSWRGKGHTSRKESDTVHYEYDALILASGAERTLGPLTRCGLTTANVDRFGIAVNPGITRDCLAHLFRGTVLHVKVPPASFMDHMTNHSAGKEEKVSDAMCTMVKNEKDIAMASKEEASRGLLRAQAETVTKGSETSVTDLVRYFAPRQHDGTFVSSVNTIWRYLQFFNKLTLCPYVVVTTDTQPSDAFPATLNERIRAFWERRGVHFITSTYLTRVDQPKGEATLYNYVTNETRVVPYRLLVLDLPLVAPSFIRKSGLSGKETEGFAAVNVETLQHQKYDNIFAMGDCAALPTIKSYGAALTQVHIVSHNVRQYLRTRDNDASNTKVSFAKYNGYSSFHLVMTSWRAMWPEVVYGSRNAWGNDLKKCPVALTLTNNHMWDNLAWEDPRGFLNAVYYQLFLYEVMFYFFFTRASWNPPTWFAIPTFSELDGTPIMGGALGWL